MMPLLLKEMNKELTFGMSKSQTINLFLKNVNLSEKSGF